MPTGIVVKPYCGGDEGEIKKKITVRISLRYLLEAKSTIFYFNLKIKKSPDAKG